MDKIKAIFCDDNIEFIEEFKKQVILYSEYIVFDYIYTRSEDVLKNQNLKEYDVIFFDIGMCNVSGMKLADFIRKNNTKINIVFVSNMEQLVFESIKYRPFRFIRKSNFNKELNECIRSLITIINNENKIIEVGSKRNKIVLKTKNIIFIESFKHDITAHCIDGKYVVRDTIKRLEELLKKSCFLRIHKGCLVNFEYIYYIDKGNIILKDVNSEKKELKISRNNVEIVKKQFLDYKRG